MENKKILDKVISETNKGSEVFVSLVPKIIHGIDRLGNYFISFKAKDFISDSYLDDSYMLFYQNPRNREELIKHQYELVINGIKKLYETGTERIFEGNPKSHFFIKGKLFKAKRKLELFYANMIRSLLDGLSSEEGFSVNGEVFEMKDEELIENPALLNYYKSKK